MELKLAKAVRDLADELRDGESRNDDACECLLALARMLEGKDVRSAFGAPGDWGYGTPIGGALAGR